MKDIYVERKWRLTSLVYLDGILPVNIATAILSKDWFSEKFLVKRGTRTPCTACLKKDTISLYTQRQFVMYIQAEDCNTRLHETLSTRR